MRLLVFGGSVFLSREVVTTALARGHDVVAVTRGRSGPVPAGAFAVVADRDVDLPESLTSEPFDAVIDVADKPSHVRRALEHWHDAHWVFVSTISVYADNSTPNGRPGTLAEHEPVYLDMEMANPDTYGELKRGCEELVRARAASGTIVRPGLIVGPGDVSGRFSYWPARFARMAQELRDAGSNTGSSADTTVDPSLVDAEHVDPKRVLAPGSPSDLAQVIDVRDLAGWLVTLAEKRTAGTFDAVGPRQTISNLLGGVASGCGVEPEFVWASDATLLANHVRPWGGPQSLPLWLPRPSYLGLLTHDDAPAREAGLVTRSIAATAADTLEWLNNNPDARVTGLTADEERDVLAHL